MIGEASQLNGDVHRVETACSALPFDPRASLSFVDRTDLRRCMHWLDTLIAAALKTAEELHGSEAATDRFRGLHIDDSQVERLLRRMPGLAHFGEAAASSGIDVFEMPPGLRRISEAYTLDEFDVAVLVLAAAPELDLKYETLYAYLHDDVTRKCCSVDLALNLLCRDGAEKLTRRSHFLADAPLSQHRLLRFAGPNAPGSGSLLAQAIRVDGIVLAALVGGTSLDESLLAACTSNALGDTVSYPPLDKSVAASIKTLAGQPQEAFKLCFVGHDLQEKRRGAAMLAESTGRSLIEIDFHRLSADDAAVDVRLDRLLKEAWLRQAIVFIDECGLSEEQHALIMRQAIKFRGSIVLSRDSVLKHTIEGDAKFATLVFGSPDFDRRTAQWRAALKRNKLASKATIVEALAARFRLSSGQIDTAVAAAVLRTAGAEKAASTTASRLFESARLQTRHLLDGLAMRIEAARGWNDLVLPEDAIAQLREICSQFAHRHVVLDTWRFGEKLPYGTGISALFSGSSGTGKTMAAEVIAAELGLDLYKIDLAGVVSKYIGETEKNLEKIFRAATDSNAILFFDEADALFGKRSEVKDSHDRYANLEVSYLLQRIERFEGVAILATNSRESLDTAFLRRLTFCVHFPVPDEALRLRMWERAWPDSVPRSQDLDLKEIAEKYKLPGGNIKNIALAATYLAAADGGNVTSSRLLHALRREHQKLGKPVA